MFSRQQTSSLVRRQMNRRAIINMIHTNSSKIANPKLNKSSVVTQLINVGARTQVPMV